jgi:hypothetical protein
MAQLLDEYGDPIECLDDSGRTPCSGEIEYRFAMSASGRSFPRCQKHFDAALDSYYDTQRRYPRNAPSDFDPSYAGERWEDED